MANAPIARNLEQNGLQGHYWGGPYPDIMSKIWRLVLEGTLLYDRQPGNRVELHAAGTRSEESIEPFSRIAIAIAGWRSGSSEQSEW